MTVASYDAIPLIESIRRIWCRLIHTRISWPVNGEYECQQCFRRWPAW